MRRPSKLMGGRRDQRADERLPKRRARLLHTHWPPTHGTDLGGIGPPITELSQWTLLMSSSLFSDLLSASQRRMIWRRKFLGPSGRASDRHRAPLFARGLKGPLERDCEQEIKAQQRKIRGVDFRNALPTFPLKSQTANARRSR